MENEQIEKRIKAVAFIGYLFMEDALTAQVESYREIQNVHNKALETESFSHKLHL